MGWSDLWADFWAVYCVVAVGLLLPVSIMKHRQWRPARTIGDFLFSAYTFESKTAPISFVVREGFELYTQAMRRHGADEVG